MARHRHGDIDVNRSREACGMARALLIRRGIFARKIRPLKARKTRQYGRIQAALTPEDFQPFTPGCGGGQLVALRTLWPGSLCHS